MVNSFYLSNKLLVMIKSNKERKGYNKQKNKLFLKAEGIFKEEVLRLVELRKEMNIPRTGMADATGMSERTLQNFEKGLSPNGVIKQMYFEILNTKLSEEIKRKTGSNT